MREYKRNYKMNKKISREENARYARSLIEASLDPLVTISIDGKITDVNEGSIKVTGISREKLVGTDFSDYFTEPEKARAGYKQVFADGLVTDYPLTIHHLNGTLTHVLYNASVYTDEKGEVLGVFAAARDVTAKKELEKQLAEFAKLQDEKIINRTVELAQKVKELSEAKAKDEAILLSLGAALVVVDKEGKIEFVNKAFEELLGWAQSEVLGKFMVEVIPREDEAGLEVPFVERILSEVLAGKKITTSNIKSSDLDAPVMVLPPYYYIRKDKTRFPAAGFINPILLNKRVVGAVEIFRDITKEKESDTAKSDFISLAAHQLRTPLSVVSWYIEMLLDGDGGELNEIQKDYFQQIYNATERMLDMVNSLLNVALLDVGAVIIHDEHTDVALLIQDVMDEQKKDILEKEMEITFDYTKNLPLIKIDPKRLRMVLQNLISNSVKYTEKKGKIKIKMSILNKNGKEKKELLLSVEDNGLGIPFEFQSKIFTKFFRADNVVQRSTAGTGLGMYLAKNIVEASGGKIWFESKENIGTTFYVTLPM